MQLDTDLKSGVLHACTVVGWTLHEEATDRPQNDLTVPIPGPLSCSCDICV